MILVTVCFTPKNSESCTETLQGTVRFEIVQLQVSQPRVAHCQKTLASRVIAIALPELLCQGEGLLVMAAGFTCVSKKEVEGSDSLVRLNDCLGVLLPGQSILGCRSQAQGLLIARDGGARIAQGGEHPNNH